MATPSEIIWDLAPDQSNVFDGLMELHDPEEMGAWMVEVYDKDKDEWVDRYFVRLHYEAGS